VCVYVWCVCVCVCVGIKVILSFCKLHHLLGIRITLRYNT
jgi:hypothetical protein